MRDAGRIATSRAQPPGIRSARRSDILIFQSNDEGKSWTKLVLDLPAESLADTCRLVIIVNSIS